MDNDYGFCTHCGATLPKGAEYCPECGTSFVKETDSARYEFRGPNPLIFFMVMLAIYGGFSIAEGILAAFFNDVMISNILTVYGSNIDDYLYKMGLENTDQLADILYKEGIVSLIDGMMVLAVFVLCKLKRNWKAAVAICLIASFFVLLSLVFMPVKMMQQEALTLVLQTVVGLLIARGIYLNRRIFK